MKIIIFKKPSFTDMIAGLVLLILLGTFLINPHDGAVLLGSAMGAALDPVILLPSGVVGCIFFQRNLKIKLISVLVILTIIGLSNFLISGDADEYLQLFIIRGVSAFFVCAFFSYLAQFIQKIKSKVVDES